MPIFSYRVKDETGVIRTGSVEAVSAKHASDILHDHKLTVLSLEPEKKLLSLENRLPFLNRVSRKEIVIFSRQLSTLINAKVPIIQSLDVLAEQVVSARLKEIINEIIQDIEGGKSFSESIARFPKVFPNLYVNLVKAGELSGTLDQSLSYLADQQEKDYDLISKVRGAMSYPIFIVAAILIVGALMFVFVLPQMISVLKESGAVLPLTTRILIFMTESLQRYWLFIVGGAVAIFVGFQVYLKSAGGRLVWDAFKLKLPIMGKLLRNIYMDRFARNLSTLIAGGIPIVQALHTVAAIVNNAVYREIILEAAAEVETGKPMAAFFAQKKEIPSLLTQMIKVGQQTGTLDEILAKLAHFYDKEVETTLSTLTTLLEPVIMVLLGLAVAVMVAGILLPIYNLASVQ